MNYYPIQIVTYKSGREDITVADNWILRKNGFKNSKDINSKLNSFSKTDNFYHTKIIDTYYELELFFFPIDFVPGEFKITDYYKSSGGAGVELSCNISSMLTSDIPKLNNVYFYMSIVDFVDYCKKNEIKDSKIFGTFKMTKKGSRYFLVSK